MMNSNGADMDGMDKTGIAKSLVKSPTDWVLASICLIFILICLLPIVNIAARSLSSPLSIINREVIFLPVNLTFQSYLYVFSDSAFSRSMLWTALLTVTCTAVSLAMTVLCAYPLTYDRLKGKKLINSLILMTMYFNAGTIPNYILMKDLSLIDNPLALIVPNCLSVFNMIILRSFFYGIPESLRESAELDGASPLSILVHIYLPLSTSALATLALFYAVGRWNGFSDALLYMTNPRYAPIQLKLYQIINNLSSIEISQQEAAASNSASASEGIKAAAVMFATLPVLMAYPWLQRYFISGVTIGAVKG